MSVFLTFPPHPIPLNVALPFILNYYFTFYCFNPSIKSAILLYLLPKNSIYRKLLLINVLNQSINVQLYITEGISLRMEIAKIKQCLSFIAGVYSC